MKNSLPSCSYSSNTSSLFSSPSSSSFCTCKMEFLWLIFHLNFDRLFYFGFLDPTTSSTVTNSSEILKENATDIKLLDDCTCGRLLENNGDKPICQFCKDQVMLYDKLLQQKNDYFLAQDMENKINLENVVDFNPRKRSSPIQPSGHNKSIKLEKGQQTLRQVLQKLSDKNDSQ